MLCQAVYEIYLVLMVRIWYDEAWKAERLKTNHLLLDIIGLFAHYDRVRNKSRLQDT